MMWIITQHGFYNIIQYPDDEADDILTVKARRRDDLINFLSLISPTSQRKCQEIEESDDADYRFRMKAPRHIVGIAIMESTRRIDYPRFKGRIAITQPDRLPLYNSVWEALYHLQETSP